jgi:transcription elongation factor GreB
LNAFVQQRSVTIIGIDEADNQQGQVSWVSPIARALLRAHVGDVVNMVTPSGVYAIEVLSVSYPSKTAI